LIPHCQIHALLVTAPEPVRGTYRALSGDKLLDVLARARPGTTGVEPGDVARQALKRLALRCAALRDEITTIQTQLDVLVRSVNPRLLTLNGVGVITAATLLSAAGDNPKQLVSKAAFAALTGVAPIPASSGQRVRHRLSRGGDRQANSALHRIVLLRIRHHEPRTIAYFDRRRAEGLTDRDIVRCLKRHIANEVYAALIDPAPHEIPGPRLRARRQELGIPLSVLATTLSVPYQRLRRLEIGTRSDPELEERAAALLAQIEADSAA
jgi:transposase